jgi:hypothetical protein
MLILIKSPLICLISLVVLYLWFRAAMWYLRNKHRIREKSGLGLILLEIGLAPGYVLDVVISWTIGGILGYVAAPTLSEKLAHIRQHPDYGFLWQRRFAKWV